MKSKSVLIVGCGDLGARAGQILQAQDYQVTGLRRHPERLPPGFDRLGGDYTHPRALAGLAGLAPDYVIASFKPGGRDPEGYRRGFLDATQNLLDGLGEHRPQGIVWVSSTRVLAENEGAWVTEDSALATADLAAAAIVEAERLLLSSGQRSCVIRFAGIYGDPNGRLLRRLADGEMCHPEPVHFSNRIHRVDAGAVLAYLILQWQQGRELAEVYIGADSLPAPRFEVERWLAAELGATEPVAAGDTLAVPPVSGKRCSNRRLLELGYQFDFPDFRRGYTEVLRQRRRSA